MHDAVAADRTLAEAPATRPVAGQGALGLRAEQVLFGIVLAILLLLVVPPILMLVRTSLVVGERVGREGVVSLGAYASILSSPALPSLIGGTLTFALGSTLAGLLLGGGLAWCTERTNAPFKQLVYAATFVSFAVPGILRAIGWIFILGPRTGALNELFRAVFRTDATLFDVFSMPAMILVEGIVWIPIVFLMMSASFRSMDPALEEAAFVSGAGLWPTLRRVTAHLALPAVLSVIVLTFIRSVQAFEVPLLLGVPSKIYVLTTEVYLNVQGQPVPDYSYSSAYGVLLLAFLTLCIYLYSRATRHAARYATITGKGFRPRVADLGRGRYLAGAFILAVVTLQFLPVAYIVFASFLPSLGLKGPIWQQLTLNNYAAVFRNPAIWLSVQNSLTIGVVSATVVVAITALAAWVIVRSRIPARAALDQIASLPLVIPGVVLGVAILTLYLRSPVPIYGTIWILVVAYATSYLPYGLRYAHPALLQIHPELEESGQLSGASWGQVFGRIVIPLLLPALFAGWIFVFLISLRELSVAALISTPKSPVIATMIWELWQNGNVNQVSAFGALVAMLSIAFAVAAYRFSRRWGLRA